MEEEINKLIYLTKCQRLILLSSLKRYKDLFDGNLDGWNGPPVEITPKEEASPYHARSYPIPVIHLEAFNKYLNTIVTIGVLPKINCSE